MLCLWAVSGTAVLYAPWWPAHSRFSVAWVNAWESPFALFSYMRPPHVASSSVSTVSDSLSALIYVCADLNFEQVYAKQYNFLDMYFGHVYTQYYKKNLVSGCHGFGAASSSGFSSCFRCWFSTRLLSKYSAIASKCMKNYRPTCWKIMSNSSAVYERCPRVEIRINCNDATASWACTRHGSGMTSAFSPKTWAQ